MTDNWSPVLDAAEGRHAVEVSPRTTSANASRERPRWGLPLFIRSDQVYYWTREWQQGEVEADEELQRGEARTFDSVENALRWLDAPED